MDNKKPQYKVGDILALREFDGRSTNYTFLEVASFTKSGTPRVYVLKQSSEQTSSFQGTSATYVLQPIFTKDNSSPQRAMRWYSKRETYAFNTCYGCGYTTLELYDPNKVYRYEWLSD